MLQKDVLEDLLSLIKKLSKDKVFVIVEGCKDRDSLVSLGFARSRILTLGRKPLFAVVEQVAEKEKLVVLLTDLDREGKKLYSGLKKDLSERGVFIDDALRNFLFKYTKLRQIEGLDKYIERNR